MGENVSVRNCFIIVAVILSLTVPFFTIYYTRMKRNNIENVINEYGTVKENISFEKPESNNGVIEIKEKMFLNQVNDVYLNADDYLEKTIKLEGLFKMDQGYEKAYYFVIRYGPGCCGNDGNAGFEVSWANENAKFYPPVDSWVEATGVLKSYAEDGYMQYLYLDLSSLNVLEKRGAEFVNQ